MRVSDDRYNRDIRSFHLALRMIRHEARTSTISAFTRFSAERVRNLAKSHRREQPTREMERHRGPSPTQLALLMISPGLRSEVAAMGGLCRVLGVVPEERVTNARERLPNIARGERLCTAFELFRQVVPNARLSLDQTLLIVYALAEGERWSLGFCERCHAVIVRDHFSVQRRVCIHCQQDARAATEHELHAPDPEPNEVERDAAIQQDLFAALIERSSEGNETHQGVVQREQEQSSDSDREQAPERNRR